MNYNDYLSKVLDLLSSPKVVTELLFEHTFNGEEDPNICDGWIVAKACFNLALNTLGQELRHMRLHSCRPLCRSFCWRVTAARISMFWRMHWLTIDAYIALQAGAAGDQ